MAWPEDMFGPSPVPGEMDPFAAQLAAIDAELARPRTAMTSPPPPAPGTLEPGGIPAAAIEAVAPGAAAPTPAEPPQPSTPPPYAIVPSDEPAALPPKPADPMPQEEYVDPLEAQPEPDSLTADGEIDMSGDVHTELERNPLEDEDATPEETAARLAEIEKTDPALASSYRAGWEAKRALAAQTAQLDALAKDRDRAEENLRIRDEAIADAKKMRVQIEADAQRLGAERIDTNKWWSERSVPQKIAGFIAAMVGGMVASRKGGQNEGLAFIEREIDRDIAAQRENLTRRQGDLMRRQGLVGQLFAESQDEFRSAETARAAFMGMVAKEIEIKATQFDPRGQTALQMLDHAREIRAKQAQSIAAAEKAAFDRALLVREDARKERELAMKEKKAAGYGVGGAKPTKPEDIVMTPADLAQLYPDQDVPPVPMSQKDYGHWLERRGKGAAIAKSRVETEASAGSADRTVAVPGVFVEVNGKKTPFKATAGTPEEISIVRKQVAATQTFVRLMDEAARIRTGWTSDTARSPEWQKLRANWGMAIGAAKNLLALGALSGPDMELVEKIMGTGDPTQMRSILAGVKKARENVLNFTSDSLHQIGYPENQKFDIKDMTTYAPPTASAKDETFKRAQKTPTLTDVIEESSHADPDKKVVGGNTDALIAQYVDKGKPAKLEHVLLPSVRAHIQELGSLARSSDPKVADDARAALVKLRDRGGNQATQDFAETTLNATTGSF